MEFNPSNALHALAVVVRCRVPSADGAREVPETPVHAASDCWMTSSISLSCPAEVWFAVRMVTGLDPSDVLHCRLIAPGEEISKRVSCGHDVPPDSAAAC